MFSGKEFGALGFSRRGEYIGGRAMSGGDQWPTPPGGAARGWPAPPYGVAALWPPPSLLWTLSCVGKNRNFGFCFVQFREYFLCNFSETQKQQKTGK
jgi:hypothetical protein